MARNNRRRGRGAMGRSPGGRGKQARQNRQAYNQALQGMGALAYDPRYANEANINYLTAEQERLQNRIDRRQQAGKKTGKAEAALAQINSGLESANNFQAETDRTEGAIDQSTGAINGIMGQIESQTGFKPGDYSQMRQQAYDNVMNEFNRTLQPQFQQQEESLRQRLYDQGHGEGSELFQREMQRLRDTQQGQRQTAMSQAFQLGQGEQKQAYDQGYQTYMTPTAQANALSPYYNANLAQNQFNNNLMFQGQQGALDRQHDYGILNQQHKNNMALQSSAPRGGGYLGGGGLSYEEQLGLMDHQFYNNLVLQGMQNGQPMPNGGGAGGGFAQGFGAGAGIGLGSALR